MKNKNVTTLSKIFKYIGNYKFLMLISALLSIVVVALTLLVPILIGDSIDLIIGKDNVDFPRILKYLTYAGIMILATAIANWIMNHINNKITYNVVRDIRNDAFSKIEELPLSYIDSHPHGDTVSRIISDADQFAEGLLLGFTQLFVGILTIVGTMAFMLSVSLKIGLVVLFLTPISLFVAKFIGSKTHNMFSLRSKTTAEQTSYINEALTNQKLISAFSMEDESKERFGKINERLEKASLRAIFFSSLVNPTTRFVNNVVYAAVALVGAYSAIMTAGASVPFTVGKLSCLLSYTNQYTKPFNEISGVITEFQNALACAERIFELIEEEPEVKDANVNIPDVSGKVTLKDVRFSYTEDKKLIENLNLNVLPGQKIAIVGPTGCGKTTIINLLMRFYDTTSGEISVDSHKIKDISRHSLRKNYGMVLQETYLFAGTVRSNISMGRSDATDEEIIAAAKAAHAHGFIKRLKDGYDTEIGEGGSSLSQGQRQLICIARVMLTLPPMLILDEATSSIDTRTEIKIQEAFGSMMVGRTSFIVAHRLSTIKNADMILVMKDGHIIEKGTHSDLIALGGFYRELYDSQFLKTK